MTPTQMAEVLATAMTSTRPWTAEEISDLIADPTVFHVSLPDGFALGRVAADEAELLTIAVNPTAQRRGVGTALLSLFEQAAQDRGAARAFLEVADDNAPARALYAKHGWAPSGRRPGYYKGADALILSKPLIAL
ncbi:MAG: GNAT family N-acetyltransferase [Pseudomonadota bacterium]